MREQPPNVVAVGVGLIFLSGVIGYWYLSGPLPGLLAPFSELRRVAALIRAAAPLALISGVVSAAIYWWLCRRANRKN